MDINYNDDPNVVFDESAAPDEVSVFANTPAYSNNSEYNTSPEERASMEQENDEEDEDEDDEEDVEEDFTRAAAALLNIDVPDNEELDPIETLTKTVESYEERLEELSFKLARYENNESDDESLLNQAYKQLTEAPIRDLMFHKLMQQFNDAEYVNRKLDNMENSGDLEFEYKATMKTIEREYQDELSKAQQKSVELRTQYEKRINDKLEEERRVMTTTIDTYKDDVLEVDDKMRAFLKHVFLEKDKDGVIPFQRVLNSPEEMVRMMTAYLKREKYAKVSKEATGRAKRHVANTLSSTPLHNGKHADKWDPVNFVNEKYND